MNLNFCWVVLLGIVSHYFLQDFIKIVTTFPVWEKRDFPKFIHLFFFKTSWTFTNNGITSRSRNRFFFTVPRAVTCRGFISGWLKSTCAFPLHTCFTSIVLYLRSNTEMHLKDCTVEMQNTTFVVGLILSCVVLGFFQVNLFPEVGVWNDTKIQWFIWSSLIP